MTFHHESEAAPDGFLKKLSMVIEAASLCGDVFTDEDAAKAIKLLREVCNEAFGLTSADCDEVLAATAAQAMEQAPLFEIPIDGHIDLPAILAEANQTLVDLMLRSEQQAKILEAQNQELMTQVSTDGLTGLANRLRFDQFLEQQFRRSRQPLSLILVDVDGFKAINDRYGHQAGDLALIATARVLNVATREGDLASRVGGDEFALILPNTDPIAAGRIAASICQAVNGLTIPTQDMLLRLTVSAGVATHLPGAFQDEAALVRAADRSLYEAKACGRNCVRAFESPRKHVA